MMLLALAAVSAAMFAMPAVASAGAPEIDVNAGTAITGHGVAGSLAAAGEPTITCETTDVSGTTSTKTTGKLTFDFTGCHIVVLGFTIKCRSAGSALDNTIQVAGEYHTTYLTDAKTVPGISITPGSPTVLCGSTRVTVTGTILGTLTAPKCGASANQYAFSFTATNGVQDHRHTTGTGATDTLIVHTENSAGEVTSTVHGALVASGTINFPVGVSPTLTCV